VDVKREADGWPLVGFILMVDEFDVENGATRFVPGSHLHPCEPDDLMKDATGACAGEVLACGPAGSMIFFNGSVWHGHSANRSKPAPAFGGKALLSHEKLKRRSTRRREFVPRLFNALGISRRLSWILGQSSNQALPPTAAAVNKEVINLVTDPERHRRPRGQFGVANHA